MPTFPKSNVRRLIKNSHVKGQSDHVDAWLMSYADMITLLFMFFVIMVAASASKHGHAVAKGEPAHPYIQAQSGLMALGSPYDEMYRSLIGTVISNNADQNIAVERKERGVWIELSAMQFFAHGDAAIPKEQLPFLMSVAHDIKAAAHAGDTIEVESYTDDVPLKHSIYANNWELSAMRASRIVSLLIDQGVDPAKLRAVSYGSNRPVVPNIDAAGNPIPENHNRNQRIVIKIENAPNGL